MQDFQVNFEMKHTANINNIKGLHTTHPNSNQTLSIRTFQNSWQEGEQLTSRVAEQVSTLLPQSVGTVEELEEKEGLFEHPEKCWPCLCFTQDTEARSADL